MNIFKQFSMNWWQVGIFKLCLLALGVLIGANWPEVFAPYTTALIVVAVVSGLYIGYVWIKE